MNFESNRTFLLTCSLILFFVLFIANYFKFHKVLETLVNGNYYYINEGKYIGDSNRAIESKVRMDTISDPGECSNICKQQEECSDYNSNCKSFVENNECYCQFKAIEGFTSDPIGEILRNSPNLPIHVDEMSKEMSVLQKRTVPWSGLMTESNVTKIPLSIQNMSYSFYLDHSATTESNKKNTIFKVSDILHIYTEGQQSANLAIEYKNSNGGGNILKTHLWKNNDVIGGTGTHFIFITCNSGTLNIYVDGDLKYSNSIGFLPEVLDEKQTYFQIGNDNPSENVKIKDFKIYNYSIPQTNIKVISNRVNNE